MQLSPLSNFRILSVSQGEFVLKLRYDIVLYVSYVTPWHFKIISACLLPNYETLEMGWVVGISVL